MLILSKYAAFLLLRSCFVSLSSLSVRSWGLRGLPITSGRYKHVVGISYPVLANNRFFINLDVFSRFNFNNFLGFLSALNIISRALSGRFNNNFFLSGFSLIWKSTGVFLFVFIRKTSLFVLCLCRNTYDILSSLCTLLCDLLFYYIVCIF